MIRRAVPNGPRVATIGFVEAVEEEDDLITVDVVAVEEVMEDAAEVAGDKRCFQPTSCIADVELDPIEDDAVAACIFGLTRTVSFFTEFTVVFESNVVLVPVEFAVSAAVAVLR